MYFVIRKMNFFRFVSTLHAQASHHGQQSGFCSMKNSFSDIKKIILDIS